MFMRHPNRDLPKGPQAILDAGSNELVVLIIDTDSEGKPVILGHASHVSVGLRKGEVIDLDQFSATLGKTVQAAERKTGVTVKHLHVVTSAGRPISQIHRQHIDLSDELIGPREVRRLQSRMREIAPPQGHQIIQHQLLHYIVNDSSHVKNPVGMNGQKLAADFLTLSLSSQTLDNIRLAVGQNHLSLGEIHHTASVAALVSMKADDRELGCLQLDLGAGTTAASLYSDGALVYASSLPIGFYDITRDLARVLSLPLSDAERLKVVEGEVMLNRPAASTAPPFPASGDNFIISNQINPADLLHLASGQVIERQLLQDIIRCRLEEILELIQSQLRDAGMRHSLSRRVCLSGGGAELRGVADFISYKWNKHVELAQPPIITGSANLEKPLGFAAAIGMIQHLQTRNQQPVTDAAAGSHSKSFFFTPFGRFGRFGRLGQWLTENI